MPSLTKPNIKFKKGRLSNKKLKELYIQLITPRLIEEKMLILLRQGKVSKWFSGIGQESIPVGCAAALEAEDTIFTMHRNLGVFTTRQVPVERLLAQWQGKSLGFTKGRDRSFHFGAPDYNIIGMISHLGPQLSLASGAALAHKVKEEKKVALAFTGDGATSQGEFHEALNVAAVWKLPVIFVIESNEYGLSTPSSEQFACENLADRALGYGMKSYIIEGNNILEVYQTIKKIAADLRKNPEPVLVEARTFRMRGHEEASGTKYIPQKYFDEWGPKDPVDNYEAYLLEQGVLSKEEIEEIRASIKKEINTAVKKADAEPVISSTTDIELNDVFKPVIKAPVEPSTNKKEMRFVDAVSDAMKEAMLKFPDLVLMGQDIAEYGGVFKATDGFVNEFGSARVRNTPLCESAILGIGLGLSIKGMKSMVEMQFSDFVSCGFNQIVNNLAKVHYRWAQTADVVIRMPTGGGVGAGPFHSQTMEAWFTHVPGLKVIYPSNPHDAKGLLLASFEDPNPVLFFEHKGLYRSMTQEVPEGYYTEELGKAKIVKEGEALSIITYGIGVKWAQEAVEQTGIDAEILDLRSLNPLDYNAINETVQHTGKVIILHEATLFGGFGGEISAYISEHLFEYLDAPIVRSASLDTPVPFARELEKNYLPNERFIDQLEQLSKY